MTNSHPFSLQHISTIQDLKIVSGPNRDEIQNLEPGFFIAAFFRVKVPYEGSDREIDLVVDIMQVDSSDAPFWRVSGEMTGGYEFMCLYDPESHTGTVNYIRR